MVQVKRWCRGVDEVPCVPLHQRFMFVSVSYLCRGMEKVLYWLNYQDCLFIFYYYFVNAS